jgi:DNA-binding NarL/FixJ family response regulator
METKLPQIRLLLVDDHEVVLTGLRSVFGQAKHIAVVGEAKDGLEALELIRELSPDVALVDLTMPNMGGLELIEELGRLGSATLPIVLSFHEEPERMLVAKRAGARGYLSKGATPEQLIQVVERVARGYMHFPGCPEGEPVKLTPRELEVAILIAKGFRIVEIAELLGILVTTAHTHRANLGEKLGVQTIGEIVRWVIDSGLLDRGMRSVQRRLVAK